MESQQFDKVARRVFASVSRRRVAGMLGGLALSPLLGTVKGSAKKKRKPKKKPFCLNGVTVQASGQKIKKLKKQGATPGACCVPQCNGTSCGGADGCGGTCGCNAGAVCNAGTCTACTVTCTGASSACGVALNAALSAGGTIVVCPGQYAGTFIVGKATALVGAGSGEDPATSTILDGGGIGQTIYVSNNQSLSLSGMRVIGGSTGGDGGGLQGRAGSDVRVDSCAFVGNRASNAGGAIATVGKLSLRNTLILENDIGGSNGGGVYFSGAGPHVVTDCTIVGNKAGKGGALYLSATTVTVTGTEIRGNKASAYGGGVRLTSSSTLTLDSATSITGNIAPTGSGIYGDAGAAFNQNGAAITGNTPGAQCVGVTCT